MELESPSSIPPAHPQTMWHRGQSSASLCCPRSCRIYTETQQPKRKGHPCVKQGHSKDNDQPSLVHFGGFVFLAGRKKPYNCHGFSLHFGEPVVNLAVETPCTCYDNPPSAARLFLFKRYLPCNGLKMKCKLMCSAVGRKGRSQA